MAAPLAGVTSLWEGVPWGQCCPSPSPSWSSPALCYRHQFCFRMGMGKGDQSFYWEPPSPTGWVWAGCPWPQPTQSLTGPSRRKGRAVCPGHHIIGNTWNWRLRWCLCCRASPPGWTLMDGTGRTRANSQGLQLRRFELDMAENLVSRRVVQPWDRYPQGGGISILGGCQVSFDKAMAYCWASSEWDTGLDTSKDLFPPTLLRSLARIDPEKSCPAPTPSCFSKVCWFLGQATG